MKPIDAAVDDFHSPPGEHARSRASKTRRPLSKTLLLWCRTLHIYSSMFALLALFFFSATGFTLNHPAWFNLDKTITRERKTVVPEDVAAATDRLTLVEYLRAHESARGEVKSFKQTEDESTVNFTGPGATATFTVARLTGDTAVVEETRNLMALLGDLHKAKYTGPAWPRLVDATALLLAFISLTGLVLWCVLPKRRPLGLVALIAGALLIVGGYGWMIP